MTHENRHIQDLVQTLQGALAMFGVRRIVWRVRELHSEYNVRFTFLYSERGPSYSGAINISRSMLEYEVVHHPEWWDGIKWNIIRGVIWKIADESKPAKAEDVEYVAEVDLHKEETWKLEERS